ncbi:hypothetical protein NQ315_003842 [Exocentrus adspersus]|uniref:Cytochrome c oxidase subunit n=1 Tax=Exocentrus adspersus TaxID=1586481 RepID=A0AAV8VYY8_9CUCU|nr:hypothetical protein NQ315_003842 [Exocentrus adspersus]
MSNPPTNSVIWRSSLRRLSHNRCPPVKSPSHPEGGYKIYKLLTFVVGLPAILTVASMIFIKKRSHECEERPEFVPYEYLRRRTKRFPWGDGNKSFFHNPAVNALPDGYEEGYECVKNKNEECEEECEDD